MNARIKSVVILLVTVLLVGGSLLIGQTPSSASTSSAPSGSVSGGTPGSKDMGAHVLPPGAREKLNLSADQAAQIDALEAQVTASLQKILTADQFKTLSTMHPRGRGGRRGPPPEDGAPQGQGN